MRWTENRNFEAFTKLLSQKQIHLLDLVSEEIAFEDAPSVYEKFDDEMGKCLESIDENVILLDSPHFCKKVFYYLNSPKLAKNN